MQTYIYIGISFNGHSLIIFSVVTRDIIYFWHCVFIEGFMDQEKFPVIVKPVESAGSDGVPWTVIELAASIKCGSAGAVRVVAETVDYCMGMTDMYTFIYSYI